MRLYDRIAPYVAESESSVGVFKQRYLCIAIKTAYRQERITLRECDDLCKTITQALGGDPRASLTHWLYKQGYTSLRKDIADDYKQVQQYRLRWLKHLCEEYENEVATLR